MTLAISLPVTLHNCGGVTKKDRHFLIDDRNCQPRLEILRQVPHCLASHCSPFAYQPGTGLNS